MYRRIARVIGSVTDSGIGLSIIILVVTEGEKFGARVKLRCNKIKSFPVLAQIFDPPDPVRPNTYACCFDGFMG